MWWECRDALRDMSLMLSLLIFRVVVLLYVSVLLCGNLSRKCGVCGLFVKDCGSHYGRCVVAENTV